MPERLVAALLTALALLLGAAPASATDHHGAPSEVCAFTDPAIVEASALVVARDGLLVTSNDSGDTGRVFVVDPATGDTVGVTHWSDDPVDVEALAPAGPGHVWVGDLGDNDAQRASITVTRVPVGRGDRTVHPTTYHLVYPDGARDAETLMWDPRRHRLLLASKEFAGASLYLAPRHLSADRPNRLRAVGDAPVVATDGAFFPDGRHFLVRGYGDATVYDAATLRPVTTFPLPDQPQGEGIAIDAHDDVYVSSEGVHSAVLRVPLQSAVRRVVAPGSSSSASSSASSSSPPAGPPTIDGGDPLPPDQGGDPWPWLLGGLVGLGALVVLVRSLRPR